MTTMTGREAVIQVLKDEGVEYVFGLPGSTELMFMDALAGHPELKYILGLHEVVPLGMAEGYARISGKVSFVNLHTHAGLAAASPMLINSRWGGVPMVITAGHQHSRLYLREPHLAGNLVGLASDLTKWSTEVTHAENIPMVMQRAFKIAKQPPTGPVFVSLPLDTMEESVDYDYIPSKPLYTRTRPDRDALNKAAELLAGAQNPVMVVEAGVTRNNALDEVIKLVEMTGAKVYQTWQGDVNFPSNHPQYLGDLSTGLPTTREMLQKVDVLTVIGLPLFSESGYTAKPHLTPYTKVIQIDDNPWEIAKNFPCDAGLLGDIKVSLTELIEILQKQISEEKKETIQSRIKAIAEEKNNIAKSFIEKDQQEKDNIPIAVSRLMNEVKNTLPPGAILAEDTPSGKATLLRVMDFTTRFGYLGPRVGACIGWGLPAALGIKMAAPDRPVVAVVGDGSAIWSIQSLWTAAHYNIPVTFVICANASYRILKMAMRRKIGDRVKGRCLGMDFEEPRINFSQLAQSMGLSGQRVEKPDELNKALKEAFQSNKANVVEVYIEDDLK